jgi:plasmid maintenance system antidote protein VapI
MSRRIPLKVGTPVSKCHPLEKLLKSLDMPQRELADRIHVPYPRVNELVNRM